MIGLADSSAEMDARGLTPALLARVCARLGEKHGVPIDCEEAFRLHPTRLAALVVVGTRLNAQAASSGFSARCGSWRWRVCRTTTPKRWLPQPVLPRYGSPTSSTGRISRGLPRL